MSLVNDMLRDLEARRAGDLGAPSLQREVRALPSERKAAGRGVAVVLVLAVAAGGLGWGLAVKPQAPIREPASASSLPAAPLPAPAPEPVAPAASPATVPSPAAEPVLPLPAQIATDAQLPVGVDTNLRLTRGIAVLPPEPPSRPAPPAEPPRAAEPAVPPPARIDPPPVAKAAAPLAAGVGPASIEKTAVVASPRERAEAEYRRAQTLLAAGQTSVGAEALAAALRLDQTHVPARQALLRLLLQGQRFDEAAGLLNEGLEALPAQVGWAMTLARLQVEKGDLAAAEHTLARSAPYAKSQADYAGFHGHILGRLGQSRAAVERYELATRLGAGEGRWWFGLGQALEGDGRSPEARDAYRRALATGTLSGELAALAESRLR